MPSEETQSGRRIAAFALLGAALLAAAALARAFDRFAITGGSMRPGLEPGDRLVVGPLGRLRRGHIVIVQDPRSPGRAMAKRVAALPGETVEAAGQTLRAGPGQLIVLGDSPDLSTDSRVFGPVPLQLVSARAWYRYAPEHRAGRI